MEASKKAARIWPCAPDRVEAGRVCEVTRRSVILGKLVTLDRLLKLRCAIEPDYISLPNVWISNKEGVPFVPHWASK